MSDLTVEELPATTFSFLVNVISMVNGTELTLLGKMYGFRRRWLGFEPDCSFRHRFLAKLYEARFKIGKGEG